MYVREATTQDSAAVRNVLDGGLLELDSTYLETAIESDDALVAVREADEQRDVVLGALVLSDSEILAIAVRTRRRGQGIGAALVGEALDRNGRLRAEFDARVRPFWESLGFAIEPASEENRFYGRLSS